mgnify:CR=1 FL=1
MAVNYRLDATATVDRLPQEILDPLGDDQSVVGAIQTGHRLTGEVRLVAGTADLNQSLFKLRRNSG